MVTSSFTLSTNIGGYTDVSISTVSNVSRWFRDSNKRVN